MPLTPLLLLSSLASYYLAPILRTVGITSPSQIAGINGGLAIFVS